jgi:hypothetical protein
MPGLMDSSPAWAVILPSPSWACGLPSYLDWEPEAACCRLVLVSSITKTNHFTYLYLRERGVGEDIGEGFRGEGGRLERGRWDLEKDRKGREEQEARLLPHGA